jgi:hypothetical protein
MRGVFVPDEEMESIANGRDARSLAILLEKSVFGKSLENWGEATIGNILASVEKGNRDVLRKTADLVARNVPEHFDLIFSRMELEQIKEAGRWTEAKNRNSQPPPAFFKFSSSSGWTKSWTLCKGIGDFKTLLKSVRHPFAEGINPGFAGSERELELEKYYFGAYLKGKQNLAGPAWGYFADQNDLVNLHTACVAGGRSDSNMEARFVRGSGRIGVDNFSKLCATSGAEFQNAAGKITRLNLRYRPGNAGFAQSIRRGFLTRWRVAAISNPATPLAPLVFLEELSSMTANLKLALNAGANRGADLGHNDYLVDRKIA